MSGGPFLPASKARPPRFLREFALAGLLVMGVGSAEVPAPGEPLPDELAQHGRQLRALLAQAPSLLPRFVPASRGYIAPVSGVISSGFGLRDISVGGNRFHGGIDIAVDVGTPVFAAADGVVSHAGWAQAYGYAVYVGHEDGSETRYAHLSELWVDVGQFVRQGDEVGRSGSSGAVTGPHLHFEIRIGGSATDPLPLLSGAR